LLDAFSDAQKTTEKLRAEKHFQNIRTHGKPRELVRARIDANQENEGESAHAVRKERDALRAREVKLMQRIKDLETQLAHHVNLSRKISVMAKQQEDLAAESRAVLSSKDSLRVKATQNLLVL
jgi:hypothetical protein